MEVRSQATGRSSVVDDVDAVVLAVGAKGMNSLMAQSPRCSDAAGAGGCWQFGRD